MQHSIVFGGITPEQQAKLAEIVSEHQLPPMGTKGGTNSRGFTVVNEVELIVSIPLAGILAQLEAAGFSEYAITEIPAGRFLNETVVYEKVVTKHPAIDIAPYVLSALLWVLSSLRWRKPKE